jgi:Tfp pilus assembly protein PilZ
MGSFEETDESKRKKPRYQLALKAEIWIRDLQHHIIERTANISIGGLFLCTDLNLPQGDIVHVRIIFKDLDAYFDAKTKIVWRCDGLGSHPMGLGLEFIDLNDAQIDVIDTYLSKYINVRNKE